MRFCSKMSERVEKHKQFLAELIILSEAKRRSVLKQLTSEQLETLIEVLHNFIEMQFKKSETNPVVLEERRHLKQIISGKFNSRKIIVSQKIWKSATYYNWNSSVQNPG